MVRGQRDRDKEQHWRQHLAAWRRSGQSIRAYCRAQRLSEPSFYAWRRTLSERRHAAAATAKPTLPTTTDLFVPVRLIEPSPGVTPIEVVLRGGRLLRVTAGFAPATMRDLIAVLEDLPC